MIQKFDFTYITKFQVSRAIIKNSLSEKWILPLTVVLKPTINFVKKKLVLLFFKFSFS